ncbi:MAG: rod-binding protein [Bdellovibrionales bacterium]|nr:rod-binding protein [Bdellovibrionales bacterium]
MSDLLGKIGLASSGLESGQLEFARMKRQSEQLEELKHAKGSQNIRDTNMRGEGQDPEKAAEQFEALLLQEMMKEMWKTVPSAGLISGSREEELYRDMLNEQIAKQISESQPLGIKDLILREMEKEGGGEAK